MKMTTFGYFSTDTIKTQCTEGKTIGLNVVVNTIDRRSTETAVFDAFSQIDSPSSTCGLLAVFRAFDDQHQS